MKTYEAPVIKEIGEFRTHTGELPFLPYIEQILPFRDRSNEG